MSCWKCCYLISGLCTYYELPILGIKQSDKEKDNGKQICPICRGDRETSCSNADDLGVLGGA